jgi:predicted ester cyclase
MVEDFGGAPDYTEIGTGRHITDVDGLLTLLRGWVAGFSDARGTVTSAMRDGDRLCAEITWEGTHDGDLVTPGGTLPASGNRMRTSACELFTVRDGQVVQATHYLDVLGMLTQLSAVPAQASGSQQAAPATA